MTKYENVGSIHSISERLFEWSIPCNRLLRKEVCSCFTSPHFSMQNSSWYFTLYPNGQERFQSEGWIGLFLHRADIGSPINITYTLCIKCMSGSYTNKKTYIYDGKFSHSGEPRLLENRKIVLEDLGFFLKFSCLLNICSFTVLQETPNVVSCAIQTEIPDSVSCASQTEVPDRVTDKENFKDEDELLLDTKEDTILRDRMKELLIKGSDYDVTICVQDKKFQAHRNILSARSPVFAMMLKHETKENDTGTIIIEDCDPDTFNEFLLYVYSGRTENLTPGNALQLYYTADKYDFPVLKERCVNLLKTSLSITSVCDVVLLAARHHEKELLEVAAEFFAQNMEEILVSLRWQTFMIQNPVEANELYIKCMKILVSRK